MKPTSRILIIALCFGAVSNLVWGQQSTTDPALLSQHEFKSYQNGAWNNLNTWQEYYPENARWYYPAYNVPKNEYGNITVQSYTNGTADTVWIVSPVSADQLTVNGRLEVRGELGELTISDDKIGPVGYDFTVFGELAVDGGLKGGRLRLLPGASAHISSAGEFEMIEGPFPLGNLPFSSGGIDNQGDIFIEGTFKWERGSVTGNPLRYGGPNGGRLWLNNAAGSIIDSASTIWPSANGPAWVNARGPLTMNVPRTLSGLTTAAHITNAYNLSFINFGPVAIDSGGFFDSSPMYSDFVTLVYQSGSAYNVGDEWAHGTTVGRGIPRNVEITNHTTVYMPSSPRRCPGVLTIGSGLRDRGTLILSTTPGADLSIGTAWSQNSYGVFIPNSRQVVFDGTQHSEISGYGFKIFDNLTINNPAGVAGGSIEVKQTLMFLSGNLEVGGQVTLGGNVIGASPTSHIVTTSYAEVIRSIAGGDSFQFPVGPSATSYNPVTIALAPNDPTEIFSVRVDSTFHIYSSPRYDPFFVQRTWDIQEATPFGNHAALTFQWAGDEEGENFTRNASSTYLDAFEVASNSMASGADPYIVSTMGGFPCTRFSQYTVGTSGALGTSAEGNWDPRFDKLGTNGFVSALAVSTRDVYAGGQFGLAGDVPVNSIAKWNGSSWSALSNGVNSLDLSSVNDIAVSGSDVYVGGAFKLADEDPAGNIAKWNGSSWSVLGGGVSSPLGSNVNAIAVSGNDVYVSGYFTTAGDVSVKNIAKWNGSSWSDLGGGVSGTPGNSAYITAIGIAGSDVYAGGQFGFAGDIPANNIAKWNGSSWSALGSGVSSPALSEVTAIAVSGNDVYVGGFFTTAGDVSVQNIAMWNSGSWSALGSGVDSPVLAIAASRSDVYVGGYFNLADNIHAKSIAKWNGSSWSALGSGVNYEVYAIAVSGDDVYVGGSFSMAGNMPSYHFGLWHAAGTTAVDEKSPTKIPRVHALSQNYPNPFNPSTTIQYAIPKAGEVMLKVFDLVGKKIATLVSEKQSAGEYTVRWNPVGLPSGVYFYRLEADDFAQTKKLLLMK